MAEEELWRGERAERHRVMKGMEEDRAARYRRTMAHSGDEEYGGVGWEGQGGREAPAGHRGRGPRGYRRSDERMLEDVSDRLTDDPHLDASEIQVAVTDGEVTLTGTVDRREARRRAEDLAESVSGVRYVMNSLRVRQPGTGGGDVG
jgi:osmotically-inducible protein OsmY